MSGWDEVPPEQIDNAGWDAAPPEWANEPPPDDRGLFKKGWDALQIPSEMSREGWDMLAKRAGPQVAPEYTGNLPRDIAMNTGRVMAETARDTAPGFVDRTSIILGAAGKGLEMGSKIPWVGKAVRGGGKLLAKGVQKFTGVGDDAVRNVFTKPMELFKAPTKTDVRQAYKASEVPGYLDDAAKETKDIIEEGTSGVAAFVKRASKELVKQSPDPRKIIQGRQALDKQIAMIDNQIQASKGPGKSALIQMKKSKLALRREYNRVLDKLVPNFRGADAVASRQFAVDPFRRVTLPGNISFFSPAGIMRAIPGLPTAMGATISGAGAATKAVGQIIPQAGKIGYTTGALLSDRDEQKPLFR